eukprot:TRINITY_DN13734_c0_g1_i5.p1 TRINITY_DN13734_c0_g1~~TRINITY_DN13734_c0_g1_i5.p1  ORF type:complete len:170 (+),score=39.76 TRINITY_DN13734_c0_g1_i5:89-598(+)
MPPPPKLNIQNNLNRDDEEEKQNDKQLIDSKQLQKLLGIGEEISEQDFIKEKYLGQGSSGTVELATYKKTGEKCALKSIYITTTNEKVMDNLRVELNTLKSCETEHVIKCKGTYIKDTQIVIMMEYMDLGSLTHILQKAKKIPEVILGMIAYQVSFVSKNCPEVLSSRR